MVGASRQQIPLNAASATSGDAAERPLSERLGIADASGCGPSRSLRKRAVLLTETSRQRGAEEEREVEDRRCPWGESDQTCDAWSDSASGCDCALGARSDDGSGGERVVGDALFALDGRAALSDATGLE
jgi:hypothetical protein